MRVFGKIRTMLQTPIHWWHILALKPLTRPIHPGLWFTNIFFQRILGINFQLKHMVHFTSQVVTGDRLKLGLGVEPSLSLATSGNCYLQAINGIEIGSNTMFSAGVKIISANHDLASGLCQWIKENPIIIGENCWIGANAIILPGVTLGKHCIVGAGAVVTKSFTDYSVVGGVPAKLIYIRHTVACKVEEDCSNLTSKRNN